MIQDPGGTNNTNMIRNLNSKKFEPTFSGTYKDG